MPSRLPEPARQPSLDRAVASRALVRAAASPSTLIATAVGVGIGFAVESVAVSVGLGIAAWLGGVATAVVRAVLRRRRRGRLDPVAIDPWAVPEPWRGYVRQALRSEQRFDEAVSLWPPGPVQDRLVSLRPRLRQSLAEIWELARRGASLGPAPRSPGDAPAAPMPGAPDAATLSEQLRQVQAERQRAAGNPVAVAALGRTEDAVASQLRAARRAEAAAGAALDGLRSLTARLDEAVTELLEVGAPGAGASAEDTEQAALAGRVGDAIAALADEITALHAGLEEAGLSRAVGGGDQAPALPAAGPVREDPTS